MPGIISHFRNPGSNNRLDVLFDPYRYAGNVWWVNSNATGGAAGNGGNTVSYGMQPNAPFLSLAYAANVANNTKLAAGDSIIVMPGHVETLTGAAGVSVTSAGVSIFGQGYGRNRPQINYTTSTAAQMVVSGANFYIENCVFTPTGIDAIVAAISATGADFWMNNCEWDISSGTAGMVKGILTAATATRFRVTNTKFRGPAINSGTTCTACIDHEVGVNYEIDNCDFAGKMTQGILNATTVLGGKINNCRFQVYTGTKFITLASATTTTITNNSGNVASGAAPITAAAGFVCNNTYSAAVGVTAPTALTF